MRGKRGRTKLGWNPPSKRAVGWTFAVFMVWGMGIVIGDHLPYLRSEFAFMLRFWILFPLLLGTLTYLGFIYRRPGGKTGYRQQMDRLRSRGERIKGTLLGLAGLLLIPFFLSSTSIAFPALLSQFFANVPYAKTYRITDITERGGPMWSGLFDLEMQDPSGNEVMLRLRRYRYEQYSWQSGETICVVGRTWLFGTYIDETHRNLGKCRINGRTLNE